MQRYSNPPPVSFHVLKKEKRRVKKLLVRSLKPYLASPGEQDSIFKCAFLKPCGNRAFYLLERDSRRGRTNRGKQTNRFPRLFPPYSRIIRYHRNARFRMMISKSIPDNYRRGSPRIVFSHTRWFNQSSCITDWVEKYGKSNSGNLYVSSYTGCIDFDEGTQRRKWFLVISFRDK